MFDWLLPDESLTAKRDWGQEKLEFLQLFLPWSEKRDGRDEASNRAYHSSEGLARHEGH
jgi:hypothetical protein